MRIIAFKNYYLRDTTQPLTEIGSHIDRCELLSKIIIFVTRHNRLRECLLLLRVVNCFQKLLSSWHDTTNPCTGFASAVLWIAFKNYYLRDTTQRSNSLHARRSCCELLSKIIIFVTRHNWRVFSIQQATVVNCFQKLLSSWHDTTKKLVIRKGLLLWIAFKNYYLRDTTQRRGTLPPNPYCCELLSKIIIFVTRHNYKGFVKPDGLVVNCFQKLLSSWHDTTINLCIKLWTMLWIAFKNYYLRDTTQRRQ